MIEFDMPIAAWKRALGDLPVVSPGEPPGDLPAMAEPRMSFIIPAGVVRAGHNAVEVTSGAEGEIVWCEIYIG